jgi:hypothetical protein
MITWVVFLRMFWNFISSLLVKRGGPFHFWRFSLLLTNIYPPLPTSVQLISITKTLLIVLTKNERDPPLFTSKLLIKFQNILRNTTQVIIRHRMKILFSVISSPITLERQTAAYRWREEGPFHFWSEQSVMFWLWK